MTKHREHIDRCHDDIFCNVCESIFKDEDELKSHQTNTRLGCTKSLNQTSPHKLSRRQKELMRNKKGLVGKSPAECWKKVYQILFPGDLIIPLPCQYSVFASHQCYNLTGSNIDYEPTDNQEYDRLVAYSNFVIQELPGRLWGRIRANNPGLPEVLPPAWGVDINQEVSAILQTYAQPIIERSVETHNTQGRNDTVQPIVGGVPQSSPQTSNTIQSSGEMASGNVTSSENQGSERIGGAAPVTTLSNPSDQFSTDFDLYFEENPASWTEFDFSSSSWTNVPSFEDAE